jgi:hypothetical protein
LNERPGEGKHKNLVEITTENKEVFHLSFNSRGHWHKDRLGRKAFSIYSRSLIKPLSMLVESKVNTMKNKVLWDHISLPRELHKLPISETFKPENFPGSTWAEKKSNADAAAQAYVDQYKEDIEKPEADQGYVVPSEFEVEWIGPKNEFVDPTPFIEMSNRDIAAGMGMTTTGLGRESGTTRGSAYTAAEFTIYQSEAIQRKLKRKFEWLIQFNLALITGQNIEDVPYVDITFHPLRLDDKAELYRMVRYLQAFVTRNEIRRIIGLNPLDEDDPEDSKKIREIKDSAERMRGSGIGGSM